MQAAILLGYCGAYLSRFSHMSTDLTRLRVWPPVGLISRDGISGLLLIVVAIVALYLNRGLDFGSARSMGPGFLPRLLSIALLLSGVWIALRGCINACGDVSWQTLGTAPWRGLLVVTGALLGFALILTSAGLFLSAALLIFVSGFAGGRVRWAESIVFAILMSVAVSAVFIWGLAVSIPLWPAF
jgi:hypothetical protein